MRISFLPKMLLFFCFLFLASCEKHIAVVNDVPEREANEIIVFLASRQIPALKIPATSSAPGGGVSEEKIYSIMVDQKQEVSAMAILNQNGLPRKKAPKLLDLFAKSGLVSSEREENIRYQAGLAAQIAGTIRKIDGVIDADLELSIPQEESIILPGMEGQKKHITAAVYVKHTGILDDPNSHLITKIKRLVSGSIAGLDINDVTVISDRARFINVMVDQIGEEITPQAKEYVSIWSIVMSKQSAARFRTLFFLLIVLMIAFALIASWFFWKIAPLIRKKGFKALLSPVPFKGPQAQDGKEEESTPPPVDET